MAPKSPALEIAGERGPVAADAGGAGGGAISRIHAAISNATRHGEGRAIRGARGVARSGVLPTRSIASCGCGAHRGDAWRAGAFRHAGASRVAWRGALHRRCGCEHRVRAAPTDRGWQRGARAQSTRGSSRIGGRSRRSVMVLGAGHATGEGGQGSRCHQRGADGTGCHGVHADAAAMRCMPTARHVRCARRRLPGRGATAQAGRCGEARGAPCAGADPRWARGARATHGGVVVRIARAAVRGDAAGHLMQAGAGPRAAMRHPAS